MSSIDDVIMSSIDDVIIRCACLAIVTAEVTEEVVTVPIRRRGLEKSGILFSSFCLF